MVETVRGGVDETDEPVAGEIVDDDDDVVRTGAAK